MKLSDYTALFKASPYAYLVMTPELIIMGASGAYLRSMQRAEEDIVGRYVFEAFPADPNFPEATNIVEVKASMLRALSKGEPDTTAFVRYSIQVPTPEGLSFEERYWSTVHTPIFDEAGAAIMLVQNPVDVTELYRFDQNSEVATLQLTPPGSNEEHFNRAQMHSALARILNNEREHLRSLFNQAPGFVAVLMGQKHVFEMVNEAYYQLVGHRELIGKTLLEALPEVAGQGFEEYLASVFSTGQPWSARAIPIMLQRERDGEIAQRFMDLVYEPYKDKNGLTIGIFAQGYDVTESVEAQVAKRESDERLKDGMEAAKMVVWDWSLDTGELEASENISQVLGFTPEHMDTISQFIHSDDRDRLNQAYRHALKETGSFKEIVRIIRPDNGKHVWLDSRGRVQYSSEGLPARMRGVTVDVTERYQAEFELREADRKKDEFLAMLAHELRNPLAPISTAAELLKIGARGNPNATKFTNVISRQVKHMTALVDDLLDVSRVSRGLVQLDKEIIDIKTVIAAAIEQAQPLIEERQHKFAVQIDAMFATVNGDRVRLVQVLANLLNNAAKYTPQGGEIALMVTMEGGTVKISITDNGIGIEGSLLPSVFELFTQAARTPDRSQGGLGIGLALVKNIISLHGGKVTASSMGPGKGSTFSIYIPEALAPNQELTSGSEIFPSEAAQSLSIMVVDDNVDAAESLTTLLTSQGHRVLMFTHPFDALAAAHRETQDVFVLDIGLPQIDGYELVRRLRADVVTKNAIFIALTGYGQAHDKVLSAAAGFHHHFVKPMNLEKLRLILNDAALKIGINVMAK